MRTRLYLVVALGLGLISLACNISGGSVDTAAAEIKAAGTQAVIILTDAAETAAATEGASALPIGGGPSDTETSPGTPDASVTPTVAPTAAPSPTPAPHLGVAFISGGNPWLVEPPAAPRQLSTAGGVEGVYLSSDGDRVVYTHHPVPDGPAEVRVVNSDGSGDRALLTSVQVGGLEPLDGAVYVDIFSMTWIPGTHRIFFNTRGKFEGPGLARYDDLFMLDADTGALTTIFTAGDGGDPWPSPDGTKLAISRSKFISLANIDGSSLHASVITFPAVITYSEYSYSPGVVWAADSSRFGAIIPSEDPFAGDPTGAIWSVDASTGAASLLSTLHALFFLPQGVLSPALDRVGYVRSTSDPTVKDSYVSALDGSSALHLASGSTAVLSFAPDGQHFSYYVGSPNVVYIGSLGGGTVLVPGSVMRLKWINNSQFVFAQGTMAAWNLQLGNTGGGATLIASPAGDNTTFDANK
jgi:hypothetical protein